MLIIYLSLILNMLDGYAGPDYILPIFITTNQDASLDINDITARLARAVAQICKIPSTPTKEVPTPLLKPLRSMTDFDILYKRVGIMSHEADGEFTRGGGLLGVG